MILFLLSVPKSGAQIAAPQFMITWGSNSYAPSDYRGKVLATGGSTINASFELLNAGKLVDVSQQTVYWYLNDNFLQGGTGLQKIRFVAPQNSAGGTVDLRVEVPNYQGGVLKTATLPISKPLAVIEPSFAGGEFSSPSFRLKAHPYFFNINDPAELNFFWNVNGQNATSAGNSPLLDVNVIPGTPSGFGLNIALNIQGQGNVFNSAASTINLAYKP